jgi:hypothetical protein
VAYAASQIEGHAGYDIGAGHLAGVLYINLVSGSEIERYESFRKLLCIKKD